MSIHYSPHSRSERLIAVCQAILATVALVAICLDPHMPSKQAEVACSLLGAFAAYSPVADDGGVSPYAASTTTPRSPRAGLGPRSLKERVARLGGSLTLESSEQGASLEIALPTARRIA